MQTPQPEQSLYHQDFALWVEEQVAALRAGDVAALDVQNLTLELEGLTKRDERALGSQLKQIMTHLLKQRYQPERASRELAGLDPQRSRADRGRSRSKPEPGPIATGPARAQAASEARLQGALPLEPPFSLEEVLGDDESTGA